jgi:ABC-2 type transport system permease protein
MLRVAQKSLREIVREPQLLGLTLLLPMIFLGITAVSYGGTLLPTYSLWVVDPDGRGAEFVERLRSQQYADGRPVFVIQEEGEQATAEQTWREESGAALIVFEPAKVADAPFQMRLVGDALSGRYYRASVMLEDSLRRYLDELQDRPELLRVEEQDLVATAGGGPQTEFDLYAPGMIVFALLMIIPQTAMLVAREFRWRTLRRLQLTGLTAVEYLGGISLAQLLIAAIQVGVVLAAALAMGFHNQGALGPAVLVGLAISFSSIGLGIVVACFSENDSQAANVGSTVAMLQVFLSGSFYRLPPFTLFTLAGHPIDLFDVLAATHGFSALQQTLSYGVGLREVAFRLGATLFLGVIAMGAGMWLFGRRSMRPAG